MHRLSGDSTGVGEGKGCGIREGYFFLYFLHLIHLPGVKIWARPSCSSHAAGLPLSPRSMEV